MLDLSHESHENGDHHPKEQRGLGWLMKVILLLLAMLTGFFEHALGGWGGPIAMATAAVVVPILLYRRFWHKAWFWITAALLGTIQVPMVAAVRPLMDQARSFYMLTFVMVDGLFVIAVISLISPKSNGGHS